MTDKEFDIALGAELRKIRKEKGLTCDYIAGNLGITHSSVLRWESGRNTMTAARLMAYLKATGTDPNAFIRDFTEKYM